MCILLSSCTHPDYPLILLSNRDEYFIRPTQLASVIEDKNSGTSILAPLDLARSAHGTWIGCSTSGRICVLVNYRESTEGKAISKVSRGSIPNLFLTSDLSAEEWELEVEKVTNDFQDIGGFSLLFGELKYNPNTNKIDKLKIISNKTDETVDVFDKQKTTIGLSNSLFNNPWPKVKLGKKLLNSMISKAVEEQWNEDKLIDKGFEILSTATPSDLEKWNTGDFDKSLSMMKESIFIPAIKTNYYGKTNLSTTDSGVNGCRLGGDYYGTRTQTVILVDNAGNLKYIEKTLHSKDDLDEVPTVKVHEFKIKSWVERTHI